MIQLIIPPEIKEKHKEWFQEREAELYEFFDNNYGKNGTGPWLKESIGSSLRGWIKGISKVKCGYCERKINDGGGYPELDHFYPKKYFHDKVFELNNLIASCEQCNRTKGTQYEYEGNDMLNPYECETFAQHLCLVYDTAEIEGISEKGRATVHILGNSLNVIKYLDDSFEVLKGARAFRKELCGYISGQLDLIRRLIQCDSVGFIYGKIMDLLEEVGPDKKFTAAGVTVLLNSPDFKEILNWIKNENPTYYAEIMKLVKDRKKYCLSYK